MIIENHNLMIGDQIWLLSLALSIMEYQNYYKSSMFIIIMDITIL